MNQACTQNLKMARDLLRVYMLESLCYLWEEGVGASILRFTSKDLSYRNEDIPEDLVRAATSRVMEPLGANMSICNKLCDQYGENLNITVEYNVSIYSDSGKMNRIRECPITASIDLMTKAVMFCMRFTGNTRVSQFLSY